MDDTQSWKTCFSRWPHNVRRRGVLVMRFDEQVPFSGFRTGAEQLLVERTTPDPMGARMLIVPYSQIAALKVTDPLDSKAVKEMGFEDRPASV